MIDNFTSDFDVRTYWPRARAGEHVVLETTYSFQAVEQRALASSGGSAVPTRFADRVSFYQRTLNPMLNPDAVTMLVSGDGAPLVLPRLTSDASNGGTITAEAAQITHADPTISSLQLNPYKYTIINIWSAELDTDNVIGLEDLIARSTARSLALDAGTALTTGNGSNAPNGIISAATVSGTATGTATNQPFVGYTDLVDLYFSVAAPYRAEGSWMVSNTGFAAMLKMRDDQGQPVVAQGWGPFLNQPTLFARPIYENPAMAAIGSASKSFLFGSLKAYAVQRVNPVRIELSRDYRFGTDELALKVVDRVDGDLIDTAGVRVLVSANA